MSPWFIPRSPELINELAAGLLGSKVGMVWSPFVSLLVSFQQRINPIPSHAVTDFLELPYFGASPRHSLRNYQNAPIVPSAKIKKKMAPTIAPIRILLGFRNNEKPAQMNEAAQIHAKQDDHGSLISKSPKLKLKPKKNPRSHDKMASDAPKDIPW